MKSTTLLTFAALIGGVAVTFGAFGAHALENALMASGKTETYKLAVSYLFYHVPALLALGILSDRKPSNHFTRSGWCFLLGLLGFSGSLFILSFIPLGWFNLITPIGGLLLICGWLFLAVGVAEKK